MVRPSNAKPVRKLPPKIGGKYRPIRVIGRGGMSVVYEVEHEFTKDRLALKVLNGNAVVRDPMALERFRREARVSTLVRNSEHIVRVFDADIAAELNGAPFLVMDLLRGQSVGAVAGNEPQPPERIVGWFRQVARALDLAHQHGVVHRDLKPENLFLAEAADGTTSLKVLDFGVASIPSLETVNGTATGGFVGTPLFMSPEQAAGANLGPSADMWSVGMCVYRLLSGKNYWDAHNVNLLLAKIVYEQVASPSERGVELGAPFDAWFLRSCARAPAERWPSVGLQVEGLAAALGLPVLEVVLPVPAAVPGEDSYADAGMVASEGDLRSDSLGAAMTTTSSGRPGRSGLVVALAFAAAAATAALLFGRSAPARVDTALHGPPPTPVRAPGLPSVEVPNAAGSAPEASISPQASAASRGGSASETSARKVRPRRAPSAASSAMAAPAAVNAVGFPARSVTAPQTSPAAPTPPLPTVERVQDPLADPD
jgi:serine/threonine-protein kinase